MSHIRYYGILLWNEVAIDWLSVSTWFGTFTALGSKMQARGLVNWLFVAQTTWFGMPDVCNVKGVCVCVCVCVCGCLCVCRGGMISKTMTYVTAMTYRWALGWGRHSCRILSYLYQKVCLLGGDAGWDRIVYWSQIDVLGRFCFAVGSEGAVGPDAVQSWVIFNDMPIVSYWFGEVPSFRWVRGHNWENRSRTWCPG